MARVLLDGLEFSLIRIDWGAATDRGLVRALNEDSLLADPPVFLVADGMGGYQAGDTASAIVVEEFTTAAAVQRVTPEWVMQSFNRADSRIRFGLGGGTTVAGVAAVEQDSVPYWLVFNIGDSRVYRVLDGVLEQVSVDHSVVQELVDTGTIAPEDARFHPDRHIITRAVGANEAPQPDFWLIPAEAGERLLLCSDGLNSELDPATIQEIVTGAGTPQAVADALVARALLAGGRDNVTAVVVDVLSVGLDDGVAVPDSGMAEWFSLVDDATRPRALHGSTDPGERR